MTQTLIGRTAARFNPLTMAFLGVDEVSEKIAIRKATTAYDVVSNWELFSDTLKAEIRECDYGSLDNPVIALLAKRAHPSLARFAVWVADNYDNIDAFIESGTDVLAQTKAEVQSPTEVGSVE